VVLEPLHRAAARVLEAHEGDVVGELVERVPELLAGLVGHEERVEAAEAGEEGEVGLPHDALAAVPDEEPPARLLVGVAELDRVADGDVDRPPLEAQPVVRHLEPPAPGRLLEALRDRHLPRARHEGAGRGAPGVVGRRAVELGGGVHEPVDLGGPAAQVLGAGLLVPEAGDDAAHGIEPDLDPRVAEDGRLRGLTEEAVALRRRRPDRGGERQESGEEERGRPRGA
jgi:hypothetical protein